MNNFKHKKSLGQNFLNNNEVINKIVESVSVDKGDLIIEIGPGEGILTKALKKFGANIICYEIDERLKDKLSALSDAKTEIIYSDFLKADVFTDINKIKFNNLFIIANLPYYITTPIIEKIINLKLPVTEIIIMIQSEVADRFNAKPKSKAYGSLTVYLNYYFEIQKLFNVGRENFNPIPNVDSSVISLKRRNENFNLLDEKMLFKLVKDSFRQKRKTIKNNLKEYDIKAIEKVLINNNLSLSSRAEEISIDVFVELANELSSQK